ncbi:MAG: biotin--[acetyl-CoA-carboxylase] ligase [Myxococcales bacterium]|nr:biotin--[acetyl-CoA-carboxylase] ligase [Myxococcales bacterium]
MANDFDPDRLRQLLSGGRWGQSLDVRATTSSTMDDAAEAAAAGAPDGYVVLANEQTHGRGARGRQWVSPPGTDIYFSVVAHPVVEPASSAMVTLAAGLGVRDAVAAWVPGRPVTVKWPNDIWIDRRKCAGVLVESRTVGTSVDSVIIGVGVNVNRMDWPVELAHIATSLRAERAENDPLDREQVFVDVLSRMEQWVERFVDGGPPLIVRALEPHLALVGERVRWEDGAGVFEGIDHDGSARVRTDGTTTSLQAARLEPADDDTDALA